ncbi:MAG: inorganic diphosphatase [Armatimonadota bacterium]
MLSTNFLGEIVRVTIDRPLGSRHPRHGFIYSFNYGFVPDTHAPDGDEIDAYVLGIFEPVTEFVGICVAVIHRTDDDKLVLAPPNVTYSDEQIIALTEFQERFFTSDILRKGR